MRIDLPTCGLKTCKYCFDGNCVDKRSYDRCEFTLLKNKTLSVDAVLAVRCRECKHGKLDFFADNGTTHIESYKCIHSTMGIKIMEPDDFCSYGERKDGDGDA